MIVAPVAVCSPTAQHEACVAALVLHQRDLGHASGCVSVCNLRVTPTGCGHLYLLGVSQARAAFLDPLPAACQLQLAVFHKPQQRL